MWLQQPHHLEWGKSNIVLTSQLPEKNMYVEANPFSSFNWHVFSVQSKTNSGQPATLL